jgi:site-specific recombinase XerD
MGRVKAVNFAAHDTIESLLGDWVRHLKAQGAAERTPTTYIAAIGHFTRWLTAQGLSSEVGVIRRDDVEAWTAAALTRLKPATVSLRWRALHVFFKWAETEELVTVSPMGKLHPPKVPVKVVPLAPPNGCSRLRRARTSAPGAIPHY